MKSLRIVVVVAALVHLSPPVFAQVPTTDAVRQEARERFDRGLHLFNDGDNSGALAEFKRAYDLTGNKLLLLNLGLVYAAMGRPVEAVATLDKLLVDTKGIDATRVEKARTTREIQSRRVGFIKVTTNIPAAIEIDGIVVATVAPNAPLPVAGGTHVIAATAGGYLPRRQEVTVAGGATEIAKLELLPSEARLAHLTVRSATPDAEVNLDGQAVGRTPLPASLTVAPGRRVIQLRRPGYLERQQEITLGDGASGELVFDLEEDHAAEAESGRLTLQASEDEIELTVDGRPRGVYRAAVRLPAGKHALRIVRGGFEAVDRTVEVPARAETVVRLTLRPTPETRTAFVDHARAQRKWAWLSLVSGAVVAGASTVFVLSNQSSLSDAVNVRSAVDATRLSGGVCDKAAAINYTQCDASQAAAYDKVNQYETRKTLGFVGIGIGVAAAGLGVVLLATADDPAKYDRAPSELAWIPTGWVGPNGGGLGLSLAWR